MNGGQTCATCRFWQRQGAQIAHAERDPSCPAEQGICRATSPAIAPVSGIAVGFFPRTHQDRWCGGWRADGTAGPAGGEVVTMRRQAA